MTSELESDLSDAYAAERAVETKLGESIRKLRREQGLTTQADLADLITRRRRARDQDAPAVSVDTISRIERGGNFTRDMLEEVAHALGFESARDLIIADAPRTMRVESDEFDAIAERLRRFAPLSAKESFWLDGAISMIENEITRRRAS